MTVSHGRRDASEHLGFDDLTADRLAAIQRSDFERFCRALLDVECADRHAGASIRGPFKEKDGGKDLVVRPRGKPAISKEAYEREWGLALTEDDVPVCFSCKTGPNWRKTVLEEADRPAGRRVPGPIDFLKEGGHFVVLLNESVPTDGRYVSRRARAPERQRHGRTPARETKVTVTEELARIFSEHLDQPETSLEGRIRIITADELTGYIRRRRPIELGAKNLRRLGIERISCVRGVVAWRKDHEAERQWPQFVTDDDRRGIERDLWDLFQAPPEDAAQRVFWIHGLPGVGKTRLLLDLFEQKAGTSLLPRRARVAFSASEGREAIERYEIFERYPGCVLVVDDCPADFVDDLVRVFRRTPTSTRSILVLLTPGQVESNEVDRQTKRGVTVRRLPPLSSEARELLIKSELGELASAEIIQRVNQYSEGFPWYAVLIARGLRDQPEAPLRTAGDTARLVLKVGTRELPPEEQRRRANERARCLLAAMLTNQMSWDGMAEEDRNALCNAVDLDSWRQITERADECIRFGLLRMRYKRTFKYVTPQILAREVALMLLRPPDGGPHSPVGPRIREHAPRYASALFELLDRLDVSCDGEDPSIAELAYDVLGEIGRGPDIAVLGKPGIAGAPLRFAVRRAPGRAAAILRRLVETSPKAALHRGSRLDLLWALEALSHRRAGFDDAEAALFQLACEEKKAILENDPLSANAAQRWASLFLVGQNATYRTFAERLPLLRARCSDEEPAARLVALEGVARAVNDYSIHPGGQEPDGPYATPKTYAEIGEAKIGAWSLLLGSLDDPAIEVQQRARKLVVDHLRGTMRIGLADPVAAMIAARLDRFDERGMIALREQIEHVKAHDMERIRRSAGDVAWSNLVQAAAPRSFRERLRQGVGTWSHEEDDPMGERALARLATDAMSSRDSLLEELDWLDESEAGRSVLFFIELGKKDATATFLPVLLARAERRQSMDALSGYLKGHQESGRGDVVEGALRSLRDQPTSAEALGVAVVRLGATEERMEWLTGLVRDKALSDSLIGFMILGSWERTASDASLQALVAALVAQGSVQAAATGLVLALRRLERRDVVEDDWLSLLEPVLGALTDRKLSVFVGYEWERGLKLLARRGSVEKALSLAIRALEKTEHPTEAGNIWGVLYACKERDPVATWRAFTHLLDRRDAYRFTGYVGSTGFGESFPVEEVMEWVDGDERHAIAAAHLCDPHSSTLSPLARALLIRFGPDSKVARELAVRAYSTPSARHSLADFSREQAHHARIWANDPHPHVRVWAREVQKHSEADMEMHDAYEEHDRQRWGT